MGSACNGCHEPTAKSQGQSSNTHPRPRSISRDTTRPAFLGRVWLLGGGGGEAAWQVLDPVSVIDRLELFLSLYKRRFYSRFGVLKASLGTKLCCKRALTQVREYHTPLSKQTRRTDKEECGLGPGWQSCRAFGTSRQISPCSQESGSWWICAGFSARAGHRVLLMRTCQEHRLAPMYLFRLLAHPG